jgi:glycosyltransferase involved in cell wall biosynthesis
VTTATVVVCVYTEKRWDDIVAAVESVASQDVPPVETLVVVDHNPALLDRAQAELTDVKVLANAHVQGLSGARNTAIAEAKGDVVVFLDDDARARPGWLAALLDPYEDATVQAVGGVAHSALADRGPTAAAARTCCPAPCRRTATPRRARLDRRLHLHRQPTVPGRGAQPHGLQHVVPARRCSSGVGGLRRGDRRIGKNPLGLRGDRALHPRPPVVRPLGEKIRIVFEPRAEVDHRVSSTASNGTYLRRRSWPEGLSKAAVAQLGRRRQRPLSTERDYVAKVLLRRS